MTNKNHAPRFAYIAPTYSQCKKIAWDYLKHYTQKIPGTKYNETELRCDFINGASDAEIKASTTIGKLLKWVKRYLTDKATNFLINASMNELEDTIDLLNVMDPTDTQGIFKPKAI